MSSYQARKSSFSRLHTASTGPTYALVKLLCMCVFVCISAGTRSLEFTAAAQRKPHSTQDVLKCLFYLQYRRRFWNHQQCRVVWYDIDCDDRFINRTPENTFRQLDNTVLFFHTTEMAWWQHKRTWRRVNVIRNMLVNRRRSRKLYFNTLNHHKQKIFQQRF